MKCLYQFTAIAEVNMHNLWTVTAFEIGRTLKKPSFWLATLSFPVLIIGLFALAFFSGNETRQATQELVNQQKDSSVERAIIDDSGIVSDDQLKQFNIKRLSDKQSGLEGVKNGTYEVFYYIPRDVAAAPYEVYGKELGIFENSKYETMAKMLLGESVRSRVDGNDAAVLTGAVRAHATLYKDGRPYNALAQAIVPGSFLVLFYMLIAVLGGQMLASTTEEKENRVIEMILTTVRARTLIIGKIIALIGLGVVQSILVVAPLVLLALVFGMTQNSDVVGVAASQFGVDASTITLDWARIVIGAVIFIASLLLFTGLLVTIGAATPTAKEASSYFGVVILCIFAPLYGIPMFISSPQLGIVQFLTYFPVTAPIPLMLRNAVGNLTTVELVISVSILIISAILVLRLAVHVFGAGVLQYSRTLKLREIFRK